MMASWPDLAVICGQGMRWAEIVEGVLLFFSGSLFPRPSASDKPELQRDNRAPASAAG